MNGTYEIKINMNLWGHVEASLVSTAPLGSRLDLELLWITIKGQIKSLG